MLARYHRQNLPFVIPFLEIELEAYGVFRTYTLYRPVVMENGRAGRQPCPQLWSFCMGWRVPARQWPAFTQTVGGQLISLTMSDGADVFSQIVQTESRVGCVPTPWTPS